MVLAVSAGDRPPDRASTDRLHLGFACAWWSPRQATWSYIAPRLRAALEEHATVSDIEAQRSLPGKALLKALYWPRRGIPWQYSPIERRMLDRAVRRKTARLGPDAVLGIAEADTPTDRPTFLYQDANFAAVVDHETRTGTSGRSHLLPSSGKLIRARAAEQLERCRSAAGVFATSRWFAGYLTERGGVPPERVHVVPFAMNNPPAVTRDPGLPVTGRLLFVGVDFERKGGLETVEAVRILRDGSDLPVSLTVAGPRRWPLAGRVPDFVDFRGAVAPNELAALYSGHDLFVMPSHFEAFGIVFAEALAAGLPCVGRRAFAMPEIIEDGATGALVESEDPAELAALIATALGDERIHERVAAASPEIRHRYSWPVVSAEIVGQIEAAIA